MPTQLSKGITFNPGDIVDAADLNNLVDAGNVLKGMITEATLTAPNTPNADSVLYYNSAAGDLRKCHVGQLQTGVTSVHLTAATPASVFNVTGTPTITTAGTFGIELDDQIENEFLAGPASGTTAATPAFRALVPKDTASQVSLSGLTINCTLGNVFVKTLTTGGFALRLINGSEGQRVSILLIQGGAGNATVTWGTDDGDVGAAVRWPGGTDHTMTTGGVGRADVVNFLCTGGGEYWGTFDKNFLP